MRLDGSPSIGLRVLRLIVQHEALARAVVGQLYGGVSGHAEPVGHRLGNPPVRAVAGLGGERAAEAPRPIGRELACPLHCRALG